MKRILIIILLGITLFQLNLSAQQSNQKDFYFHKIQTFTKMKHAGIGMTVGGVVLTIVGVKMIADGAETYNNGYGYYEENDDKIVAGVLCTELGVGLTAGGIVLWSIGGSKARKYNEKYKSVSLNLNADPRQKLSLVFNF
jgi:hypothetical protein